MGIHYYKDDLPDDFIVEGRIGVDTETMGLNNNRDRLCVVQVSKGDGEAVIVHFSEPKVYNCPNLKALMQDDTIIKIFHFARFDVATIKYFLKVDVNNIYCTKIASKLVRTYTQAHGLKALLKDLLKIKVDKYQQRSYWGAENLTSAQLEYAASDVLYLPALMDELNRRLKEVNRYDVAQKCFSFLPSVTELDSLDFKLDNIFLYK